MLTWTEMLRLFGPSLRRTLMKKGSPDRPEPPLAGAQPGGESFAGSGVGEWRFSREELRAINDEISQGLPVDAPVETMLALVDIDPSHVHAYWQVQRADLVAARRFAGVPESAPETLVLKVHDALCMTMSGFIPWPPLELEVSGLNGSRHLEVPDSSHTLIAELGLRGPNDVFVPLTWSRPVHLPRPGQTEIPERVDLVVVDEPGNPPRVMEVLSAPSGQPAEGPGEQPAATSDHAGSYTVLEAPVSSHDLSQGVWSSGLPFGFSDDERD